MSGLGVEPIKLLGFHRVFLGTVKPDIGKETGQSEVALNVCKSLIYALFASVLRFSAIPDIIAVAVKTPV